MSRVSTECSVVNIADYGTTPFGILSPSRVAHLSLSRSMRSLTHNRFLPFSRLLRSSEFSHFFLPFFLQSPYTLNISQVSRLTISSFTRNFPSFFHVFAFLVTLPSTPLLSLYSFSSLPRIVSLLCLSALFLLSVSIE